ncbi:MAG: TolC family protein, partial [Planctomycetota bacterium]
MERGNLAQQQRLYQSSRDIQDQLRARESIDSYRSQIARVDAAIAERFSQLQRSRAAVRNAEARIRALVNDPELGIAEQIELLPVGLPVQSAPTVDLHYSIESALQNRPEIHQSLKEIRAASLRVGISKNEILPKLDMIAQMYLSGLRGQSDLSDAFGDQFSAGAPSYILGLTYEMPIGNRAARARMRRRLLETRRLQNQLRATTETLKMEVEVAVREVQTTLIEIGTKYDAMKATVDERDTIQQRWELLTGTDGDGGIVLDNLLRAQERLTQSEFQYLQSLMTFNLALVNLKRAEGTLLQSEGIIQQRGCVGGLPFLTNEKAIGEGMWAGETSPGMPEGKVIYEMIPESA